MTGVQLERQESGGLRACLIRANARRLVDRYTAEPGGPIDAGGLGRVWCWKDNMSNIKRAVKKLPIPPQASKVWALRSEVNALVALDHPHIVRLVEYFVEDGHLLLVMELLEGPSLRGKMQELGRFGEQLAARCMRHMLKALFCCHCHGIAHNDVSADNFMFDTPRASASLKLVDFGEGEHFDSTECQPMALQVNADGEEVHRCLQLQAGDMRGAGALLYEMLSGSPMALPDGLDGVSNVAFIRSNLQDLEVSVQARGFLEGVLLGSTAPLVAREALMHPFITDFYTGDEGARPSRETGEQCLQALCLFHRSVRLKQLALLLAAHLLPDHSTVIGRISYLFRYIVRDGHTVEERALRRVLDECGVAVPSSFAEIFRSADVAGVGGLTYSEFLAVCLATEPHIFCREQMLRAIFSFLDVEDSGFISDSAVKTCFQLPMCQEGSLVAEALGPSPLAAEMDFNALRRMMEPPDWMGGQGERPAPWSLAVQPVLALDSPLNASTASEGTATPQSVATPESGKINRVVSQPSEAFEITQLPGFHNSVLRPYYAAQPISNVLMGIIRGTSQYVRQCLRLRLTELVQVGEQGAFFFMPNPKYHWTPQDAVITELPKLRIVSWWIHPDFVAEMMSWMERLTAEEPLQKPSPFKLGEDEVAIGNPGDFGYSGVAKPTGYLNTCRDFCSTDHVEMLEALVLGMRLYLDRLLGPSLSSARLSAGFHYPVRPQYSTLHLQLRVNAGDICEGEERRGVDLFQLLALLRENPQALCNDSQELRYRATANLRLALVTAAKDAGRNLEEVGQRSLLFQ